MNRTLDFPLLGLGNTHSGASDCPILGLDDPFPDLLVILRHPIEERYACYCHNGVYGLACFSNEDSAYRFAEFVQEDGMTHKNLKFNEVREVAKARPMPVVAIMLLDRMKSPKIHFVR